MPEEQDIVHSSLLSDDTLYEDQQVTLSGDTLVLHHYYFPGWSKNISVREIERIEIRKPTLRSGKWRIWGTGDVRTWFPADLHRPERSAIFVMYRKKRWRRIGFTVEDPQRLRITLQNIGVPTLEGE